MSDIYKRAAFQNLLIETPKGKLTVYQTTGLSVEDLDTAAVAFHKQTEALSETTFLTTKSTEDRTLKLKFDIVLDILETKVASQETAAKSAATKAYNKKIDTLIAAKQDEEMSNLSVADLEALRQ
jgi:hypothetical protein